MKSPSRLSRLFSRRQSKIGNPKSKIAPTRRRPFFEPLENRSLLAGFVGIPNDPGFPQLWRLHNTGQTGGVPDADIDALEAWSATTGSMATVVAILDSGVDYTAPDLYLSIWLNEGEIPANIAPQLSDADADGLITFRDLNAAANSSFVVDINANGYIDGGDVLSDPNWENGIDDDGNGRTDDLIGWDFHDNDNDPWPTSDAHGTGIADSIGAIGNNGLGNVGFIWTVSMMPVRIRSIGTANTDLVNANAAAGIDYAVTSGASISNNSWRVEGGGYEYSQEIYDAIDRARLAGHLFVTAAGNDNLDNDLTPFFPGSYDLDNVISATATLKADVKGNTNYGLNSVDLGAPSDGGTSGASAITSGVAALLKSLHPDWTYTQIKDRILSTVDPLPSLAGKTVSGGRLNAANALGVAQFSISDTTLNESPTTSVLVPQGSGGLAAPKDITLGPDGNLYVASAHSRNILRFNATTGQFLDAYVPAGTGGLQSPFGVAFGPDGDLYVTDGTSNAVLRFQGPGDSSPGAFVSAFVTPGAGGLNGPSGLAFGNDGNLYVGSRISSEVMRFEGPLSANPGNSLPASGQPGAVFVPVASGGLAQPIELGFGPDGNLYVTSSNQPAILRFDAMSGAFIDEFVSPGEGGLNSPRGFVFDQDGRMYLIDCGTGAIHRYDSQGNFLDDVAVSGVSGLATPIGVTFDAQGALLVANGGYSSIHRFDRGVIVSISAPNANPVSVDYVTVTGTANSTDFTSQAGTISFLPGQTTRRILLGTRDDVVAEANESFVVQLSDAIGGVISDASSTVTIQDDDASRQFSVADASATEGSQAAHFRGAFASTLPGYNFNGPYFGPDGHLYTSPGPAPTQGPINRYDGVTGAYVGEFIPAGRINGVRAMRWRDGYVYVGSDYTDEVLRFNAATGEFVDVFIEPGNGGATTMDFGPDSTGDGIPELYVVHGAAQTVGRYDGASGASLGPYLANGAGGLLAPNGMTFDSSKTHLFVISSGTNQVLKFNALTGAFVGVAASTNINGAHDVKFGPDGLLYVICGATNRILRFNASGAYVDDFVPAGSGGLSNPTRMVFGPDGDLYVSAVGNRPTGNSDILRYGTKSEILFTVSISSPSSEVVTVNLSTGNGTALAGSDFAATNVTVAFPPGVTSRLVSVPLIDDTLYEATETFTVNLSNPVGGVIADAQGIGTILDNDLPPTKFYVVDDASANKTFEYGSTGSAVENYNLNSGNSAPRGAASNAAGDKVWVIDNNKTVYVYNTSGGLLGSWSAGSLASNATVQGIATNGIDIWIVDSRQDRVYRYTGAASRLSGSQNAASNFALNSSNKDATDLVTDGTSIWVTNNTLLTDKVFKYTVSGTLQGSWTISGGGGSPTGLTIDPSGASASIWIVDSSSDRVYEFTNAKSRTSGSQSPAGNFALASGNGNPQGIADPPVAGGQRSEVGGQEARSTAKGAFASSAESDAALLMWLTEDLLATNRRK